MAYTPTTWETGDTITATALNKLETGVSDMSSGYMPYTWQTGDTITAARLNALEQGVAAGGGGGSDFPVFTNLYTQTPPVASCDKTYAECVSLIESESAKRTCPCKWDDGGINYCIMKYYPADEEIWINVSGDVCVYDSEGNIFWG